MVLLLLTVFSALSFLAYGFGCLISPRMEREFVRYGLAGYRRLTGALQLAGAAGQLLGLTVGVPLLACAVSGGLALLMLLGLGVRLRIGDSLMQSAPAALYLGANAWLFLAWLPAV